MYACSPLREIFMDSWIILDNINRYFLTKKKTFKVKYAVMFNRYSQQITKYDIFIG